MYLINQEKKEETARATRMLYELGYSPTADSGDVSIRDEKTGLIYITGGPAGKENEIFNLGDVIGGDICVLDPEGKIVENTGNFPTIEAPMHLAIYKARPDVNAIVHTHALWSSVFAITGKDLPGVLAEQYLLLGGEIKVTGPVAAGSEKLAEEVVKALGKKNAAIMRHHGAVSVGVDMRRAYQHAISLENVAQKCVFANLMGGAETVASIEEVVDSSLLT